MLLYKCYLQISEQANNHKKCCQIKIGCFVNHYCCRGYSVENIAYNYYRRHNDHTVRHKFKAVPINILTYLLAVGHQKKIIPPFSQG